MKTILWAVAALWALLSGPPLVAQHGSEAWGSWTRSIGSHSMASEEVPLASSTRQLLINYKQALDLSPNQPVIRLSSPIHLSGPFSMFIVASNRGRNGFLLADSEQNGQGMKLGRWRDDQLFLRLIEGSNYDISVPWVEDQGIAIYFVGRDDHNRVFVQLVNQSRVLKLFSGQPQEGDVKIDTLGNGGDGRFLQAWDGAFASLIVYDSFLDPLARIQVLTQLRQTWIGSSAAVGEIREFSQLYGVNQDRVLLSVDATELEDVHDEHGTHPYFDGVARPEHQRIWDILNGEFYDSDLVFSRHGQSLVQIHRPQMFLETAIKLLRQHRFEGFMVLENAHGHLELLGFRSISELRLVLQSLHGALQLAELLLMEHSLHSQEQLSIVEGLSQKWGL
ncbi:hypothetical protein [Pseudobacteriovorax antillogorgiicola]|uniref:6-bladed beta-propeller protein n=1 Tax=Pseudobacteriovorax antillogorgiicola TaxID=1513793 RepID=A0A1Y6BZ02_9BACT|nr:hypothetical protein [Pseudobacteriovorax antillogorgiicola]TCS52978.1 hypothetical protein EDD56_10829 [Pseudobacteriovorax antillogorgiicola]SMF27379.1 hypothetical protein SAMN06296036_108218 [Pseudobacteriovorax antillogorgiicola]